MLELLNYPFMQRALIAGVLLGSLLALMGIFVVLRRMSFMSDGIAHASLSGVAAGLLLGANPLLTAIGFATVFAIIIALLERRTKLSSDAIIGLIFTSGMALGIVLLSFSAGYRPELTSYLFGDILSLHWNELALMAVLGVTIAIFILARYRQLALFILNQETAYVHGVHIELFRILLYVGVAVAVVLGMKLLGIILVSALLIIPVTTAKLLANSFRVLMMLSVLVADIAVIAGLFISAAFDLPPGATIILCGIALFILAALGRKIVFKGSI
jgi:ABC-type Mn2+/Zn2+ transport system permease subunit